AGRYRGGTALQRLATIAVGGDELLDLGETVRQHSAALFTVEQVRQVRRQLRLDHTRLAHRIRELDRVRGTQGDHRGAHAAAADRKSTRLNSSHVKISYAVFCLKKKKKNNNKIDVMT